MDECKKYCKKVLEILDNKGIKPSKLTKHLYRKGVLLEWNTRYLWFEQWPGDQYRVDFCCDKNLLDFSIIDGSIKIEVCEFDEQAKDLFDKAYIEAIA